MNILVAGVGGQGVLLVSNIIADLALTAGLDVKKSEVHGLAQRGGSVISHIRYGSRVFSPLIEEGRADLLVAFEKLEALRYVHYLDESGRLVYDPHRIEPLPVSIGAVERPADALLDARLAARAPNRTEVPAFRTAIRLGNSRVQNVVMLGAVSGFLEFPAEAFLAAIGAKVRKEAVELNLQAFEQGRRLAG
jgi:indolepyruvate ferredoxin oxidoreductase beta subunit